MLTPGSVFGQVIAWSAEHDLKNKLPTPEALELWTRHCPGLNVACVFGPASGNTFAVDIDVTDEDMSLQIADLADEILGYTPFRREGMAPKIALLYRHAADDVVPSTSRRIADTDHGVEILGAGKLLTVHGRHHKMGQYFKWLNAAESPLIVGPDVAPLVTSEQVSEFMAAVDARWKFQTAFTGAGGAVTWGNSEGIRVPQIRAEANVQRNASGLINGGREDYLRALVWQTVVVGC